MMFFVQCYRETLDPGSHADAISPASLDDSECPSRTVRATTSQKELPRDPDKKLRMSNLKSKSHWAFMGQAGKKMRSMGVPVCSRFSFYQSRHSHMTTGLCTSGVQLQSVGGRPFEYCGEQSGGRTKKPTLVPSTLTELLLFPCLSKTGLWSVLFCISCLVVFPIASPFSHM